MNALLPSIGLVAYRLLLARATRDVLRAYVGPQTGDRILTGSVHRSEGEVIRAAVLFADIKSFTAVSEAHPSADVVHWLNEEFDALDGPINAEGGEILKFMGDGLLAVFPIAASCADAAACARALAAAHGALATTRDLNRRRAATGEPRIGLDVTLHVGEVFYGNVGAARRLDFTVIGPAVNLASRIEQLCDTLGRNLVLSEPFARLCGAPVVPLGTFELKGIGEPQTVFGTDGSEERLLGH